LRAVLLSIPEEGLSGQSHRGGEEVGNSP
jgi:hypothetical protein